MVDSSVTYWIRLLEAGDVQGAQPLWDRYFEALVRRCRAQLAAKPPQGHDGEDVALSVLNTFMHGAMQNKFPNLNDRDDLWRLLVVIAARKAINVMKKEQRAKRGGGRVVQENVLGGTGANDGWSLDSVIGDEPTPEIISAVTESLDRLGRTLPDKKLRDVVQMKLECYENQEIADRLGCSVPTVERKLRLIRNILQDLNA